MEVSALEPAPRVKTPFTTARYFFGLCWMMIFGPDYASCALWISIEMMLRRNNDDHPYLKSANNNFQRKISDGTTEPCGPQPSTTHANEPCSNDCRSLNTDDDDDDKDDDDDDNAPSSCNWLCCLVRFARHQPLASSLGFPEQNFVKNFPDNFVNIFLPFYVWKISTFPFNIY